MAWVYVAIAGLLEIVWAYAMKESAGFTRPVPTIVMLVAMAASFACLAAAMRVLPLGTAYMVWTGIGALGAFLVGVMVLGEEVNAMRIAAAALILAGLVAMKAA